jgi:predicted GNAT family N-acyltransferase
MALKRLSSAHKLANKADFLKILRINASDTFPLRQLLLRPGYSQEECVFDHDDDEQTFHLGAFIENKLVSVASFYFERNPTFEEQYQYRLRGMATHTDFQRKGLSRELLKVAFPIIQQNLCTLVWCNARVQAVGFYQTVGFEKVGEQFDIPTVGPHYLMFKKIEA